jgi:hypothetical protein
MFYSTRVKVLEASYEHKDSIRKIYHVLSLYMPEIALFPNLRSLVWGTVEEPLFSYIQLFLSPGLTELTFFWHRNVATRSYLDLLDCVTRRCSGLTSLTAEKHRASGETPSDLFERDFILSSSDSPKASRKDVHFPPDAVVHILRLPNLRHFLVPDVDLDAVLSTSHVVTEGPKLFRQLESIRASVEDAASFAVIMESIHSRCLRTIDIKSIVFCQPHIWYRISAGLAHQAHLTSLHLSFHDHRLPSSTGLEETQSCIRFEALEPLLALTNIEEFRLADPFLDPDDRLLERIAECWPRLHTLHLNNRYMPLALFLNKPPAVTITGLAALFAGCPELTNLIICLDAGSVSRLSTTQLEALPRSLTNVKNLECSFLISPIQPVDVEPLAEALSHVYGRIRLNDLSKRQALFLASPEDLAAAGTDRPTLSKETNKRVVLWEAVQSRTWEIEMFRR